MSWRRRRPPAPLRCREVVEMVTDYLEDALPPADRARFEQHLALCDPCVTYVDQIRRTAVVAAEVEPEPLDPVTEQRLVELYRTWQQR